MDAHFFMYQEYVNHMATSVGLTDCDDEHDKDNETVVILISHTIAADTTRSSLTCAAARAFQPRAQRELSCDLRSA